MLTYAKKAFIAAALSCITVILGWNIPAWIAGTEPFQWRSVVAGLVAAFISGLGVYYAQNKPTTLSSTPPA